MQRPLRRIVTTPSPQDAAILVDAGPSASFGGLSEIWRDNLARAAEALKQDLGPTHVLLEPPAGGVVARWFCVVPASPAMSEENVRMAARAFDRMGAAHCHRRDGPDPSMHQTDSLDLVCLLSGSASLVLNGVEKLLSPGDVVVQRGTAHAWRAHGGPALFFAVLIDRRNAGDLPGGEAS